VDDGHWCYSIPPPMDEKLKEQLMPAVVVFNLTLVVYLLVRAIYPMLFLKGHGMFLGGFLMHVLIGAGIGLVTGGITLGLTMMRK
jgi:hypothetical protein